MGKDALLRLKSTLLFKALIAKESEVNHDEHLLSAKVIKIVTAVAPLLERVPENMPEFTLHDPNHSAKVAENMGKLIPDNTFKNLNVIEISLLILSAYLHDVGMTCSQDEKENIIKGSEDFGILFKSDIDRYRKFNSYYEAKDHRNATFIEDQVFTEYLRRNHVERSAHYIKEHLSQGELALTFHDIPFWKHLIAICDGHGQPVSMVANTSKWPRHTLIGEQIINIQYLTLILRLADILDLDPERTPKVIYDYINPKDPISILEWKKHRSVIGYSINSDKILFEAECTNPEVERALKQFMDWIELERRETMELLSKYHDDISRKYILQLHEVIAKDRIRPDGSYISNDLKFQIDFQRVMDLLMGQRLYKSPIAALRELLQNSIDAIKIREELYSNKTENFKPYIKIAINDQYLSVEDNGVGMDVSIFRNFFLQVGKSFYSSPAYYGRYSNVDITSEFGIGVLSTFMIAHSLVVESRREPENPLSPPEPIHFEIPTAYSYTTQRKSSKSEVGTIIRLLLKQSQPFGNLTLKEIIEQLIPIPPYDIIINEFKEEMIYRGISAPNIEKISIENIPNITSLAEYRVAPDYGSVDDIKFTHKIFDIEFGDSFDDFILRDIVGSASLINTSSLNYYTQVHGKLTQRGFTIGLPSDIEYKPFIINKSNNIRKLFPDWCSIFININLTKSACLSITPDRTDIIFDDKARKLKNAIEYAIINQLKKFFDSIIYSYSEVHLYKTLHFLIATGFLGIDLRKEDSCLNSLAKSLFLEYLQLPVLDSNAEIKIEKLSEICKSETIAYTYSSKNLLMNLRVHNFIENHKIKLILLGNLEFGAGYITTVERFISGLIGNENKLLGVHTIITDFMPFATIKAFKMNNEYKSIHDYHIANSIMNLTNEVEGNNIIFTLRQSIELYPIFNGSHKLISFLLDENGGFKTTEAENLLNQIFRKINEVLVKSLNKLITIDINISRKVLQGGVDTWKERDYYDLTKKILIKDSTLLESFINIFLEYWSESQRLKLIDKSEVMPEIKYENFLHYWY